MRVRACLFGVFTAAVVCADQTVTIGPGTSFNPSSVTVAPGEKVIWNWAGSPHSTTSDSPVGPEVWDSGIQLTGATFSHTFNTLGTYPYYCVVHSIPGGTMMNGTVVVAAPATPTFTPTFTPSTTPSNTVPPSPTVTPPPPSATPTVQPAPASPTPIGGAGAAAIPDLGLAGRLALGGLFVAAALLLLRRAPPP